MCSVDDGLIREPQLVVCLDEAHTLTSHVQQHLSHFTLTGTTQILGELQENNTIIQISIHQPKNWWYMWSFLHFLCGFHYPYYNFSGIGIISRVGKRHEVIT